MIKKLSPVTWGVIAAAAPIAVVLFAALAMNVSAAATAPADNLADTQYCYTSEDGDWLICRLED